MELVHDRPLTEEQKQLADENFNLVWAAFHRNRVKWTSRLSEDDVWDCCIEALLRTCRSFDKDKGFKFSTHFFKVVSTELMRKVRYYSASVRSGLDFCSLNTPIKFGNDSEQEKTIEDLVFSYDSYNFIEYEALYSALSTLDEKEKEVINKFYFQGELQKEVQKFLGCSQPHAKMIKDGILSKIKENIELHKQEA